MLLYVNACVRDASRTKELADVLIEKLDRSDVEELLLADEVIPTLDKLTLEKREKACNNEDFSDDMFRFAKQFVNADTVVIAAPYWDLSFPAVLKKYLEMLCVRGLTFRYSEKGYPIGLCKAKKLYYITTSGGKIYNKSFGYGYIDTLATKLFGIEKCFYFSAENLDVVGNDPKQILAGAKKKIQVMPSHE